MYSFVTLFNKTYLSRGILMCESLKANCSDSFVLYILAVDDETLNYINNKDYQFVKTVSLEDIFLEYPVLRELYKTRTLQEFCWTLSAFSIQYIIRRYSPESVIYLDSDIFFFGDPKELISEMGDCSVMITEHNFSSQYASLEVNGKYCVQFMVFKNDKDGNTILEQWRKDCENKCTSICDKESFGDQKYLDTWESIYEGTVYNCRNIGCGVAPWNVQKYRIIEENGLLWIVENLTKIKKRLIFYHFQALKKIKNQLWNIGPCTIGDDFKSLLYVPYIKKIQSFEKDLPTTLCSPEINAEPIELIRFIPVPFIGKKLLNYEWYTDTSNISRVIVSDGYNIGKVAYKKSLFRGEWIIIDGVENTEFVSRNIFEIIWSINKHEVFGEQATYSDEIGRIMESIQEKRRVMTECMLSLLDINKIEYPYYKITTVTRFYDSIESEEGCVVFGDQQFADSQNIRVDQYEI